MKMRSVEKRFVNSPGHSARVAEHAAGRIRSLDPEAGARLLDVGCGNGAAAIHLATTLGLDVVGVDIDPEQIQAATLAATNTPNVRFLVADATNLPFPDDEFDFVYTNKTTHHIPDWRRAITEIVRVLKPGGHLVYSDFVAPFGDRFPTRNGISQFADALALQRLQQRNAPFRLTIVLRTTDDDLQQEERERPDQGRSRLPAGQR
jgi:ubiquinone/menaquinone biosynthesis C-methylase UbiE